MTARLVPLDHGQTRASARPRAAATAPRTPVNAAGSRIVIGDALEVAEGKARLLHHLLVIIGISRSAWPVLARLEAVARQPLPRARFASAPPRTPPLGRYLNARTVMPMPRTRA